MNYEDLNIVYEDNHMIVVVKPQNILSQGDETNDIDMVNLLKEYVKVTYNKQGNVFIGLVHRLDRPTGGLMVFAKTSKCAKRLAENMQNGRFEKTYLATVIGSPSEESGELVNYLKKNPVNNTVYVASEATTEAKKAVLNYKTLEKRSQISLLEVQLQTGRSHQIRVQLANIGCPIFGDNKYGGDSLAKVKNMNLWAYKLKFPHPTKEEYMCFVCPPPSDQEGFSKFNYDKLFHEFAVRDN